MATIKPDPTELQSLVHRATALALDANEVIESELGGIVDEEEIEDFKRLVAHIRKQAGLEPDPRTK